MVGVGGVVIHDGRTLLIRRGSEPLKGEWSIPGGMLEVGETLIEGVTRELLEETGLQVKVIELIEVFERIFHKGENAAGHAPAEAATDNTDIAGKPHDRPLYHFVILDYLCDMVSGEPHAGGDVTDLVFAAEDELQNYHLTPTATRVIKRAFAMSRTRSHTP
jgi:ADP-ribose pyrophosphatase YjhB (NUDIX family)